MIPTDLSEHDKRYLKDVQPILEGLLKELKENGWIKTQKQLTSDKDSLSQMVIQIDRINKHAKTINKLTTAVTEKLQEITSSLTSLGVGFTRDDVLDIYVSENCSIFLESTELLMKALLIAIVPKRRFRNDMTLGQLIQALVITCPRYGQKLADEIDVVLRNAIAHGNCWLQKSRGGGAIPDFCYCEQFGWQPVIEPLENVIGRMKTHNLLSICLNDIINRTGDTLHT